MEETRNFTAALIIFDIVVAPFLASWYNVVNKGISSRNKQQQDQPGIAGTSSSRINQGQADPYTSTMELLPAYYGVTMELLWNY